MRHDVVGEALIAGVKVRCEVVELDRHGLLVAKVYSPNGVDIGRTLASGCAYRRYFAAEAEARKAKRGMWRGVFVKPWEWRASSPRPQASSPSAPAGTRRQPAGARFSNRSDWMRAGGRELRYPAGRTNVEGDIQTRVE